MLSLISSLLQGAPFLSVTLLALFSTFFHVSDAATADEWRSRSIYQIVTDRFAHANDSVILPCQVELGFYCGGTWSGIREHLDYVQRMNFDAVWISPIVGQLPQQTGDGQSYTAYWQQNLYAINSKFGTEEDLHELISEVHARGMLLMLDIVVNHMGYAGTPQNIDYSVLQPFNDARFYHDYCSVDDPKNHTNAQQCWLGDHMVPLADLKTEDPEVQNMFGEWIHQMVQNYSIDGLRIDTSINVEPEFFPAFVEASGVFATGEVMMGDNSVACEWENTIGSILNYPVYYTLIRAFEDTDGSMEDLVETMESTRKNCKDPTLLGSFSEVSQPAAALQYQGKSLRHTATSNLHKVPLSGCWRSESEKTLWQQLRQFPHCHRERRIPCTASRDLICRGWHGVDFSRVTARERQSASLLTLRRTTMCLASPLIPTTCHWPRTSSHLQCSQTASLSSTRDRSNTWTVASRLTATVRRSGQRAIIPVLLCTASWER